MTVTNPDFVDIEYIWPSHFESPTLVVGIGGGSDVISAYLLSTMLLHYSAQVLYGNTKRRAKTLDWISPHIGTLPEAIDEPVDLRKAHNTTLIDSSVPRNENGSPYIFVLPNLSVKEDMVQEILGMGVSSILAVDTGGDVLKFFDKSYKRRNGRDLQMLEVLKATGIPTQLMVVGLGSDGELQPQRITKLIRTAMKDGSYAGCFSLMEHMDALEQLADGLPATRTPSIILNAARLKDTHTEVFVPRDLKPTIPIAWLTRAFVFNIQ